MFSRFFGRRKDANLKPKSKQKRKIVVARLPSYIFPDSRKVITIEETFGLIKLTVEEAELNVAVKGRQYFATISIGKQTFVSADAKSNAEFNALLKFDSSAEFVLQKTGPSVARLAFFRQGRLDGAFSNTLVGWAEVDLAQYFNTENSVHGGKANNNQETPSTVVDTTAQSTETATNNNHGNNNNSGGNLIEGWITLLDPADSHNVVGRVKMCAEGSTFEDLGKQVWDKLLPLADFDGGGTLNEGEFRILLQSFGSELTNEDINQIFVQANPDSAGDVEMDQLATVLSFHHQGAIPFSKLVRRCPVDGAQLDPIDDNSNLIYVALALNEGAGQAVMKGGYITESQAARAWMLRVSDWATAPLAGVPVTALVRVQYPDVAGGLRTGIQAAHILVYDRETKLMVEERMSPVLTLTMRNLYQSRVGRTLMKRGIGKTLIMLSEREGQIRDSPESVKEIKPFIDSFQGQIDIEEIADPISSFKSFNEFFYRKLKPGARPIAHPDDDTVVTSAADCRLQVYSNVGEATRFWIKGRNFSVAGLLDVGGQKEESQPPASSVAGDDDDDNGSSSSSSSDEDGSEADTTTVDTIVPVIPPHSVATNDKDKKSTPFDTTSTANIKPSASALTLTTGGIDPTQFYGGSMAIFRLAPQDYHRYHSPVSGKIISITDVPGALYTVNPIAVNSTLCDVFTTNKRAIMMIENEAFGPVAFVAIGATLVGSIVWTVKVGDTVKKGDELGYFAFGGSTVIVVFPDGLVAWDPDLTCNSNKSLETLVKVGERIGVKVGSTLESTESEAIAMVQHAARVSEAHGVVELDNRGVMQRMLSEPDETLVSCLSLVDDDFDAAVAK